MAKERSKQNIPNTGKNRTFSFFYLLNMFDLFNVAVMSAVHMSFCFLSHIFLTIPKALHAER